MTATDTSLASVGTQVRLAQCADDKGTLAILANDHRQNLRRALGISDHPNTDSLLGEFKALVSTHLASGATGLLVDPQFGLDATIDAGVCGTPLIVALEETGYVASGHERVTRLLPGWDPERLVRCGAHAAKLLNYYRPDARNAGEQESLARRVAQECASAGLPLFLEPLLYGFDMSVIPSTLRADLLSETARRLSDTGASVLKLEMPVDVTQESDTTQWRSACDRVTAASAVPWVLLSAGVRHEIFSPNRKSPAGTGHPGSWPDELCGPRRPRSSRPSASNSSNRWPCRASKSCETW